MDVIGKKKSPKQALKNNISNTVKKQTGGSLAHRTRQKEEWEGIQDAYSLDQKK